MVISVEAQAPAISQAVWGKLDGKATEVDCVTLFFILASLFATYLLFSVTCKLRGLGLGV